MKEGEDDRSVLDTDPRNLALNSSKMIDCLSNVHPYVSKY